MVFGGEKVIVDVKDVEHGGIRYTDKAGAEHTYYPCRSNWLEIESLELVTTLGNPKQDGSEPPVVNRIRGTARLVYCSVLDGT